MKQFLETGKIVGTHGLKGEMRVQPWSDTPGFLTSFNRLYLDPDGMESLKVSSCREHGNIVLLKAEGINDISSAEKYRNKVIYIDRRDVKLEKGSYFVQDLIGCDVFDADSGEKYGCVTDVSKTGANDVWHIDIRGREYLIPVIPDVVISTDVENGKITIRPLKGLFDDED